jgi:hypothetical protein
MRSGVHQPDTEYLRGDELTDVARRAWPTDELGYRQVSVVLDLDQLSQRPSSPELDSCAPANSMRGSQLSSNP